jgi:glycosyltransferase involved in cell wall biosynthesis
MTRSRLHVAIDANVLSLRYGGIPKYIRRVAERLAAGGDEVDLVVNARHFEAQAPGTRIVAVRLKGHRPWRELALPAWALRHHPSVLWAPESVLPVWSPVPTVVTVHDLAPLLFRDSKPPEIVRAFETTLPRSARNAAIVICVSRVTAEDVARLWRVPGERIRVIPNGVDDAFAPGGRDDARARVARLGVTAPYVLHVGSLEPRKGLDVLIAAAAQTRDWRLVLAGASAHDGERIAGAARSAGALLLGGVEEDDLVALYRGADAVASPAIYEGFGIVPLEALACGAPIVIASDAGALDEVAGPTAIRVGRRDPDAWLAAIEEARATSGRRVEEGIAHAARFTWDATAAATRDALAEAAATSRRVRRGR